MTFSDDRPFCACSTPGGASGIAVIRLSGEGSFDVADRITRIIRTSGEAGKVFEMPGYTAAFAVVFDPSDGQDVDDVVINVFRAPHSFTGDDMVEISCHGGSYVKKKILELLVANGAREALPGEFTKTAFMNGKLDLSQAEAVMNVISSDSERALKASRSLLNGKLSAGISRFEGMLYDALSLIEMMVEFPEHDDTPENTSRITETLLEAKKGIDGLADSYSQGRVLSERMRIALCGLPNSGKSSLLNCLTGYDRAIVTEVAGTTRDTLEADVTVNGIPVTLIDTAGIRETSDRIEAMGVERAIIASGESDLVFYLIAPDTSSDEVLKGLSDLTEKGTSPSDITLVFSKSDLGINPQAEEIKEKALSLGIEEAISVSSSELISLDELKDRITGRFESLGGTGSSDFVVMSGRHARILKEASDLIKMALDAIEGDLGVDVASSVIRHALDKTGEITGKAVSKELVDNIFSRFCIGK